MRLVIALALASLLSAPAAAQRFGGSTFRPAPMTVYRAPAPVTVRAPTPASAYRAPTPVSRPAPVTQPVRSYTQPTRPQANVTRATGPATKPFATTPRTKAGVVTKRPTAKTQAAQTSARSASQAKRRTISAYGRSHSWIAPATMPIWWMAAMHQPYSFTSYDSFIERCLRTPERERSKECVRALRERGLAH